MCAVWGGDPHENPGCRPDDRASGLECAIRRKKPGADPKTVPPLSVIEISAPCVTDNVRRGKNLNVPQSSVTALHCEPPLSQVSICFKQ